MFSNTVTATTRYHTTVASWPIDREISHVLHLNYSKANFSCVLTRIVHAKSRLVKHTINGSYRLSHSMPFILI